MLLIKANHAWHWRRLKETWKFWRAVTEVVSRHGPSIQIIQITEEIINACQTVQIQAFWICLDTDSVSLGIYESEPRTISSELDISQIITLLILNMMVSVWPQLQGGASGASGSMAELVIERVGDSNPGGGSNAWSPGVAVKCDWVGRDEPSLPSLPAAATLCCWTRHFTHDCLSPTHSTKRAEYGTPPGRQPWQTNGTSGPQSPAALESLGLPKAAGSTTTEHGVLRISGFGQAANGNWKYARTTLDHSPQMIGFTSSRTNWTESTSIL